MTLPEGKEQGPKDEAQSAGAPRLALSALRFPSHSSRFALCALLLGLAFLWFRLIVHLRIEWTVTPQYTYGWAVPVLCLYLLWQRVRGRARSAKSDGQSVMGAAGNASRSALPALLFALCAFLYAPTRLIQEANPEWRFISWALALIVIGLTLLALRFALCSLRLAPGSSPFALRASHVSFPLLFFLVAVPWPTIVEGRLIQWLTEANVAVTIELLNSLGIPALQHGNIIEISTGVVGVDEACSGIRSFQATLMLSLFFGELYSLTVKRRMVLCLLGFASSFVFNVARTFILTYVASKQGVPALEKWHDPAGITVLVWCFVAIWFASLVMKPPEEAQGAKRKGKGAKGEAQSAKSEGQGAEGEEQRAEHKGPDASHLALGASRLAPGFAPVAFSLGLLVWLALVEVGVEWWYRSHESKMPATTAWTAAFPTNNPTFREMPFTDRTRQFLRQDEGHNCTWREDDGTRWQGIYLRWNPGKIAVHLAKSHTPEVCLSAAGRKMVTKSDLQTFEANGLKLPFYSYVFEGPQDRVHVFYCLWEDRAAEQNFDTEELTYGTRLAPVLVGRRNSGQRTLELAVWGYVTHEDAAAAVQQQLQKIIRIQR